MRGVAAQRAAARRSAPFRAARPRSTLLGIATRLNATFPHQKEFMWLRLYTDILTSRKVMTLEPELFKSWVIILALAKEGDGLLPSVEDIAFGLRTSTVEAQRLTEELVKRGLLDSDGKNITPHNWHTRQFQSDNSTERVQRFRNNERNVSETSPETEADTETEPEQSRDRAEGSGETPQPSREKPRSVRAPVEPDDEFLDGLQKNPAYSMFNVRMLYLKMLEWCKANHKMPSRRRFINWLNKEDKPMTAKASPPGNAKVGKAPEAPREWPDSNEYMNNCVDNLIADEDLMLGGQIYDEILGRGGAKAEWEIRLVAWYELHKNEPATPEQMAELNASIKTLARR